MSEKEKEEVSEFKMHLRNEIKKELRWWKYVLGLAVMLVIFFSNIVARGIFYADNMEKAKEERRELTIEIKNLTHAVEDLKKDFSYYVTILAAKTHTDLNQNPFKK